MPGKDFEVGIKLVGDGKSLVGEVRATKEALNGLGETAKRTNTESAAAAEKFTASLKRQADTVGMTAGQTRAYEASQLQLNSAQRASVEASNKAIAAGESNQRVMERLRFAALGLAAAVGTGLVMALKSSVTQAAQAEQSQLRMQAVLNATGHAAGLTKTELDALAESGKMRFGLDDDAMRDSMAVLLTFKNINRESFGPALEGAANLAAVMQTDLKSAVLQLGKALENPEEGLTALKRSGVSFSESQKAIIKDLVDTGRQGEALNLVLKVLSEQVGGVAASMNQGMTKSTRDAGLAWDDLLKALGKTSAVKGTVEGVFSGLTDTLSGLKNLVENGDWLDRLAFFIPGMTAPSGLARGRSSPATSAASNGNTGAQASADALAGLTRQQLAQDAEIKYLAQQKLGEEAAKKREEAGKRAAQATAQAIEGSQRYAAAIKLETEQVGLNAVQKRLMSAAAEAAKAPTTALKEEIMASAQAWAVATDAQQAVIDAEKSRLQTIADVTKAEQEAARAAQENIANVTKAEQEAARARQANLDRIGNSIERTGETAFVLFASHGFKALDSIVEAGKMAAIKLAYEFTARPIILKMIASITGSMAAGAANAAGGGAMDTLFNAAGLMNAGKMLWTGFSGGIASGLGSIVGGIGSMIGSSALAAFGGGLAATGTGAAAITGASAFLAAGGSGAAAAGGAAAMAGMGAQLAALAGPLAAVAAIGTLLYMGFKRTKKPLESGIQGEFSADGFEGKNYTDWKSKAWFLKTKYSQTTTDLDPAMEAKMGAAMALLRSSTTEYASVLSLPVDAISGYTTKIKVALTGDETKDKAAIDAMFLGLADSLANLTGNFDKFIQEGETSATTLKRLATELASVDAVLHSVDMTFGAVGLESMEGRERLINLAGGLDALQQKTAFYAQNFLTEAERLAPVQADVTAAMAALGYAGITSKKELADVVRGLDLTTESGAKTYAALTTLAPAFATVADAADAANDAMIARYKTVVAASFQALQRAVDAERSSVQKHIDEITGSIGKLTSLSGTLQATLGRMNVAGNAGAERAQAQAQIAGALAIARASGVLPSAESLSSALDVVAQPSEQLFGSFLDYMLDFDRTAADINSLDALTQGQLSIEQQSLSVAQGQLTALDGILARSQAQIDAINGVNTSVMTVAAAVAGMRSAFGGPGASAAAALGATTSGLGGTPSDAPFVESLYRTLLGRAPDAAGLAGWQVQLAAGASTASVIAGFTGSQEYKARKIAGFASGGDYPGGLAVFGENGPELVDMAPARVYSNSATQKMLDFSAVVAELQAMRLELAQIKDSGAITATSSQKTAKTLVRVTRDGNSMQTTVAV